MNGNGMRVSLTVPGDIVYEYEVEVEMRLVSDDSDERLHGNLVYE